MSAAPRAFASFLAAALVLVPLPGHWRARNIPTLSLIAWLFFLNVARGVNVIEWYDTVEIKLKIWCDICESPFCVSFRPSSLPRLSLQACHWRQYGNPRILLLPGVASRRDRRST